MQSTPFPFLLLYICWYYGIVLGIESTCLCPLKPFERHQSMFMSLSSLCFAPEVQHGINPSSGPLLPLLCGSQLHHYFRLETNLF